MQIKIITCHDVYNAGASLQAYALQTFLWNQGYDIEIIDYKPDYLSCHYALGYVPTPRYQKPIIKQVYLLLKLPGRILARLSTRKKNFDNFRRAFLRLTSKRYHSIQELEANCPEADAFIAGSDQIWNPLLPNGKDAAFFLRFVPGEKRRISYAASFATNLISADHMDIIKPWVERIQSVSVRERSGLDILKQIGIEGVQVCDPVFLLSRSDWEKMVRGKADKRYVFLYDFDDNSEIQAFAKKEADRLDSRLISAFPGKFADKTAKDMGPIEFLSLVANAELVLSNSFHATAFSLIFHTPFCVFRRKENLNERMEDLLKQAGMEQFLITGTDGELKTDYCWEVSDKKIEKWRKAATDFLEAALS